MSEGHQEALAHLIYGINSDGGFVLLTGEVGAGKTTVCRCLLGQVAEDTDIAFILNPKLTADELLAVICDELSISYPELNTSPKLLTDRINSYLLEAHAKGSRTVLIIEEAQNLNPDVLEQIRLLTNLETDKRKLLQIIMIGQPELRQLLSRPELRQIAQRITARYHLGPLSRKDIAAYITHRLSVAGGSRRLFSMNLCDRIFGLSGGIPRLINVLCDRSLLGAYVHNKEAVDAGILSRAAREVLGNGDNDVKLFPLQSDERRIWLPVAAVLLLLCVVLLSVIYFGRKQNQSMQNAFGAGDLGGMHVIQDEKIMPWFLLPDRQTKSLYISLWDEGNTSDPVIKTFTESHANLGRSPAPEHNGSSSQVKKSTLTDSLKDSE